ncbi:methyltransferase family protein [Paraburkholderia sp. BL6665CI2N2]|uniref:class I SAM-dependent methyltransferase n=1 Tax=Paraburkholderia sp. BL6665CI2N2 TaxID=1938806 RepID=UPI0010648673|nr:class I SAM-dependent methyltransferase [Paraburkholderia sp. BL6665CI2N2]TDY25501.1 methyltransferase family protein [Paraburkholderia sp. BL6665CI2N2]
MLKRMVSTDREWEKFGASDPYYGVLSHDRFKGGNTDQTARDDFFSSGEVHVTQCFSIIEKELDANFEPHRALDFGCGVGRITIPLARRIDRVVGLDVSDSMLVEAKKNCQRSGLDNVDLLESDDRLMNLNGSFDFIHSFIVFQHIPTNRGEAILMEMISHLTDGGIGALHFTYASPGPAWKRVYRRVRAAIPLVHNFANLAQRRQFGYPLMQMNEYDVNKLLLILQKHGCHRVHIRFSDHDGHLGAFLFFRKEATPIF